MSVLAAFFLVLWGQLWDPARITIYRDSLGVAHVWAPTDAEAAYGLGWVQAEDVGLPLQENLLASRGLLGKVLGKEGALWDYLLHWTGLDTLDMRREVSPELWRVLEGFAAGVNAYYAAHPEKRLLPEAFPVRAEDVARGAHLILNVMAGVGQALAWSRQKYFPDLAGLIEGYGSNAWAVAPHRSIDQATYLLINSHQPLEGRFAWYEVHVGSAEGWNLLGGTFPGGPFPFVGCNPSVGWAHTFAYHQLTDVYALEVRGRRYRFGDTWLPFTTRRIRLQVKGLPFAVRRTLRGTLFGPALRVRGRWYAFAQLTYTETRALEEWYRMGKARNLTAFREALSLHALPTFNTVYADEEGHIALFSYVHLPQRDTLLSWSLPVERPTPRHQLKEKVPLTDLPAVVDPPCGYVYNTNQTPLQGTCPEARWHPPRRLIGLQRFTYNRGERLAELWPRYDGRPFSWEDLRAFKHDRCVATEGSYRRVFAPLFSLDPSRHPHLAEPIHALKRWSGCAEPHDTLTALVMLTHVFLSQAMGLSLPQATILGYQPTEKEAVKALVRATRALRKHYGTLYPRWDAVLRHGRGGVEVGVGGFWESLEARHWKYNAQTGHLHVTGGDGLYYWIKWGPQGQEVWSIQPYGASHDPTSPHYTDQIRPFAAGQVFRRTLDWETIRRTAERTYHPSITP